MPRVKLDPKYKQKCLQEAIYGKMRRLGVTSTDLSSKWRITQQGASNRIKTMRMDWQDLVILFDALEFTDEERLKYMKGGTL